MRITTYKKNGKTFYKFQIRVGKKVTRRAGFRSMNEAIQEYNLLLESLQEEKSKKIAYLDVYNSWIKIYETKVKESTFYSTIRVFELHILPYFEKYDIEDITPMMCQEFAMYLTDYIKGKEYFNQAKRVLDYAVKMDQLQFNPFSKVILPNYKKSSPHIKYLEAGEVIKLLEYFSNNIKWHALFRLMIYTGLRRGEILALEWSDIDFKKKKLSINKSLSIGDGAKVILSSTKTENSTNILDLDSETVTILKKYKLQSKSEIMFSNTNGGYMRLSNISDKLNIAIKHTGISKVRVHDLRHTHASLLFASGANMKEVQDRLRHTDIKTTMNIYTHVTKDNKKATLDNFVEYIDKRKEAN